uniref:Gustatory receptor n=1 Tax=Strigamia maritima TaxID=126957 RepID=T1JLS2_STRMM
MTTNTTNIEENFQSQKKCTRKCNRLWSRLFWLYGLQLHDVEENHLPKWKKSAIILLPRLLAALLILRFTILIIRLPMYDVFVIIFPLIFFNSTSIFTAVFLQRRENEFSTLYKILLELALKSTDNIKRIERHIYTVLSILAIFNVALFILVITYIPLSDSMLSFNRLIYSQFNVNLLKVYIFFESTFYTVFSQFFLDVTVLYFSCMCKLLLLDFEKLNNDMERAFVSTSALTNAKLNAFRRDYRYLSHLAEKISCNFSPLLLFWLVGLIVIFCIRVRSIKNIPEINIALYFGLDAARLVYLVTVIFKNSSQLLSQIGKMKEIISEIIVSGEDEAIARQKCIFLSCLLFRQTLNADNAGISVSGLFQLSTVSFLNMASTVLTYVVLVYQS